MFLIQSGRAPPCLDSRRDGNPAFKRLHNITPGDNRGELTLLSNGHLVLMGGRRYVLQWLDVVAETPTLSPVQREMLIKDWTSFYPVSITDYDLQGGHVELKQWHTLMFIPTDIFISKVKIFSVVTKNWIFCGGVTQTLEVLPSPGWFNNFQCFDSRNPWLTSNHLNYCIWWIILSLHYQVLFQINNYKF